MWATYPFSALIPPGRRCTWIAARSVRATRGNRRDEALLSMSGLLGIVLGLAGPIARAGAAEGPEPIIYAVRFPSPEKHVAEVEAAVPTEGRPAVELMMAVWSPGFYRVEDYAKKVEGVSARSPGRHGAAPSKATRKNRWRIDNKGGAPKVVVSYRLTCDRRSVTMNWVAPDLIVLNGAAAFVTTRRARRRRRPHEVRLELPPGCRRSATAMAPAPDGLPDHYRAGDYDTLVDSPIVAGTPVDPRVRGRGQPAHPGGCRRGRPLGRRAWRRATWRRWSARPGGSGASCRSTATSSSTSSAAEAAGWSTRTRRS